MSKLEDKVTEDYIAGLLAERAGYVQTKKKDRIASVDAELKRVGYKADKDDDEPVKRDGGPTERAVVSPATEKAVVRSEKAK